MKSTLLNIPNRIEYKDPFQYLLTVIIIIEVVLMMFVKGVACKVGSNNWKNFCFWFFGSKTIHVYNILLVFNSLFVLIFHPWKTNKQQQQKNKNKRFILLFDFL